MGGRSLKPAGRSKTQRPLRDSALDALARREHAHSELERKLLSKGYDATAVSEELSKLVTEGLLNDSRFAESYAYYRVRRGFGPNRLRAELKERGIAQDTIDLTLQAADFDWPSIIKLTWQKKFGRPPTDYQEKAKQARFLEYRGFTSESIMSFLASLTG
ncbi:MAG: regulatory protein RecX [Gammaproteobacteria bacterium]